jgi:hypothetical protein
MPKIIYITKELIKKLPPLYANEDKKPEEIPIIIKYFTPDSNWTWYATEGEQQEDGDWLFFGYVRGPFPELGYFSLNQLKSVRGPMGLPIERDVYFGDHMLSEAIEKPI